MPERSARGARALISRVTRPARYVTSVCEGRVGQKRMAPIEWPVTIRVGDGRTFLIERP
jgi:hypothetical protein